MTKTSAANRKTLYLVDVSSLFFRAYYAISSHLSSPKGLPTNALYGLLSMTDKFIRQHKAEYIVFCFDHEKPSFRVKMYSEYKANRGETPEDLKVQIPYIKKLVSALGIPMVELKDYEADDLIGSLAVSGQKNKFKVVIMSGDKDFAQLVNDSVSLYDPMKELTYDAAGVQKKWGVKPEQINDYLAIVGDSSDNIPGVFGIGPKGAQKLLQEYGDLNNIYKKLDNLPAKTAEKLKKSEKSAFLSKKLARIVTDIDLKKSLSSFHRQAVKKEELKGILKELGFKTFEKKFFGAPEEGINKETAVKSSSVIKRLSSNLKLHHLSWDELQELVEPYGKVWVFSKGKHYYMSFKNKVISLEDHNLQKVGHFFSDRRVSWYGYDLKKIWKDFDCTHPVPHWCSMIASYLIESGPPGGFENTAIKYAGEEVSDSLAPGEIYHVHKKVKKNLEERLRDGNMLELYTDLELPLISVLYEMEKQGIKLDSSELIKQKKDIDQSIRKVETGVFNYAKHEFNISSPKQLADVLFTEMGLNPVRKTKTGYSTDMEVLNKLKNQHPVIPLILEHRELFKLKTTYVEALPPLINKKTGRVHTHFRQALTATGRLSSINPNLQNIPIKTERGRRIRKAFVAEKGRKIISADYSQIELRILAHITGDPALCSAFKKELDIHTATASEIYSLPLKEVTEDLRRSAKAINFGLIYGQGPYTLSESLGISVSSAGDIIKNYFKRFKKVKEYMDSVVQLARKQGYVETLFGRRRFIRELSDSRVPTRKWGERAAINTPIQGTASDLVKMVMVELRNSLYSPILLQIHDELLFECEDHLLEEEVRRIVNIMENIVSWKVPLKVNIHTGKDWQTAH